MDTTKRQARWAGLLYMMVAVSAPIGLMVVPGKLFVTGNATATADHLRAGADLLRLGMASELFHQAVEVYLVLALYNLFKDVSTPLARQMALLGLIPIPIMFLNVLNEVAALLLVQGAPLAATLGKPQADALAMLFLRLHSHGIQVAAIFWGLWLFPLGMLVWRSGFIPKAIGVLVIASGIGYLIGSTATLILPTWSGRVGMLTTLLEMGEPVLVLWLLIVGA
ncbi:MAG TPA: DUF4386 domain-containing protein, partial [Holophagaceae bacterium]|nr:DUF4386 domain-containing protein [Holophagaceae bacterium]